MTDGYDTDDAIDEVDDDDATSDPYGSDDDGDDATSDPYGSDDDDDDADSWIDDASEAIDDAFYTPLEWAEDAEAWASSAQTSARAAAEQIGERVADDAAAFSASLRDAGAEAASTVTRNLAIAAGLALATGLGVVYLAPPVLRAIGAPDLARAAAGLGKIRVG